MDPKQLINEILIYALECAKADYDTLILEGSREEEPEKDMLVHFSQFISSASKNAVYELGKEYSFDLGQNVMPVILSKSFVYFFDKGFEYAYLYRSNQIKPIDFKLSEIEESKIPDVIPENIQGLMYHQSGKLVLVSNRVLAFIRQLLKKEKNDQFELEEGIRTFLIAGAQIGFEYGFRYNKYLQGGAINL